MIGPCADLGEHQIIKHVTGGERLETIRMLSNSESLRSHVDSLRLA